MRLPFPMCAPVLIGATLAVPAARSVAQTTAAAPPTYLTAQTIVAADGKTVFINTAFSPGAGRCRTLLERPDVQAHLLLTLKQKKVLGLDAKPARLAENEPGVVYRAADRVVVLFSSDDGAEQEHMRPTAERITKRFADDVRAHDEALKKVLSPEQRQRLFELDLQFRGLLALGDAAVADALRLPPEKRAAVAEIAREAEAKTSLVSGSGGGIVVRGVSVTVGKTDPAAARDLKSRLSPRRKRVDAIKEQAAAAIRALLSDDEAARWKALQGRPFSFRTDL